MRYACVAISDRALSAYMRPFFAPNVATARRSFNDEVNRADSEMNKHPEDYELHLLGYWDDVTGRFELSAESEVICRAKEIKS